MEVTVRVSGEGHDRSRVEAGALAPVLRLSAAAGLGARRFEGAMLGLVLATTAAWVSDDSNSTPE